MSTNKHLVDKAKQLAKEMLADEKGEDIMPIPLGDKEASVFVSSDPDKILAIDSFEMEGKFFYVGLSR